MNGFLPIASTKDAPFAATIKSTFEHKLADGNAIHSTIETHQARDAAGRTMTESEMGCGRDEDGQMRERLSVSVFDPVARMSMDWQVGGSSVSKVVRVFHHPEPVPRTARAPLSAEELAKSQKAMEAARAQQGQQRIEFKSEDLGVRDFNGISAHGKRMTMTIPAGEEGNDEPLKVVNDTWRSNELALEMMEIHDDPRIGRTVTEYEELNRGEPDPSLFHPPAGYTIQERPQAGVVGLAQGGTSN
jgi:hypothetical protein